MFVRPLDSAIAGKDDHSRHGPSAWSRTARSEIALFFGLLGAVALIFYRVTFLGERTFLSWFDNTVQYYAWMHYATAAWRHLTPPLWDFSTGAGTSFVGELNTGAFYPLTIALSWLVHEPTVTILDWFLLLHVALAWYGMTLFLRVTRLRLPAALFGGAVFALTGPVLARASGQANIYQALVFIPFVLAFYQLALRWTSSANPFAVAAGIAWGLTLLAGHPQPFIHAGAALMLFAMFVLWSERHARRANAVRLLRIGCIAGFAAVLTSGVQVLASVEYFARAYRWIGLPDPVPALSVVPPQARALYQLNWANLTTIWNPLGASSDGGTLFVSVTAFVTTLAGIFSSRPVRWYGLIAAASAVTLALGTHTPLGWINASVPGLMLVREPTRILCIYQLGVAILAGCAIDLLITQRRTWLTSLAVVITAVFLFEVVHDQRSLSLRDDPHAPEHYYVRGPVLQELQRLDEQDGHLYRVSVQPKDLLPPNVGHTHGIHTLLGHGATMRRSLYDYLSKDWSVTSTQFDHLAIRYVVAPEPIGGLPVLAQQPGMVLLERPTARPALGFEDSSGHFDSLRIDHLDWATNQMTARIHSVRPGLVVLSQLSYPGWKARINGKEVSVGESQDGFAAAAIPQGETDVTFYYAPWWLPAGLLMWAIVATALLGTCVVAIRERRNPASRTHPGEHGRQDVS